jgi:hypothetical protein
MASAFVPYRTGFKAIVEVQRIVRIFAAHVDVASAKPRKLRECDQSAVVGGEKAHA